MFDLCDHIIRLPCPIAQFLCLELFIGCLDGIESVCLVLEVELETGLAERIHWKDFLFNLENRRMFDATVSPIALPTHVAIID